MKVRLCDKNRGKSGIAARLKEVFPDLDVKVKKCIDCCGDCRKHGIALVDGRRVVAGDGEELYGKIVEQVKKVQV